MSLAPRVVLVHRHTELEELVARHGTRGQAAFYLRTRGRRIEDLEARHSEQAAAMVAVSSAIPADWRRGMVERADLPRFLFSPEDIVVAVGQGVTVTDGSSSPRIPLVWSKVIQSKAESTVDSSSASVWMILLWRQ